jgi:hypothetical protein
MGRRLGWQDRATCDVQMAKARLTKARLMDHPAPMSSVGLAHIPHQGTVLDGGIRHIDPPLTHEHLQVAFDKPIDRGEAILVIAAVAAPLVRQMRVDVVGLDRQRQANEGSGNEGKPDKHVTLPALGGVGAGSERREAARGARSIASLRG